MTARNDITGDILQSKVNTDSFRSGHELIWGSKKEKATKTIDDLVDDRKEQDKSPSKLLTEVQDQVE